jgi:hypothetical protein
MPNGLEDLRPQFPWEGPPLPRGSRVGWPATPEDVERAVARYAERIDRAILAYQMRLDRMAETYRLSMERAVERYREALERMLPE